MRIDAYSQVQQIYANTQVNKTAKAQKTSQATDKFQMSSIGKDIQVAKQAVNEAPDIREDKVASLKQAIQDGTYEVSGEDFADKLLAKFDSLF